LVTPAFAERKEIPQMPPQAVPEKVQVGRGGSIQIPLQSFGIPQDIQFRIHTKPEAGRLGAVQVLGKGIGVVTYRHSGENTHLSDRFTYATKGVLGVSAEAEVVIQIVDPPPILAVPTEVDFGKVLAGSRISREVEIANRGGGIIEGRVETEAPWRVGSGAEYQLAAGQSQRLTLIFESADVGRKERSLIFRSKHIQATTLTATVVPEIQAGPELLVLKRSGTNEERIGMIEVINNTAQAQTVHLDFGEGITGENDVELAPLGSEEIKTKSYSKEQKEFTSVVTLKTEKTKADVRVVVEALPGRIGPVPATLSLPPIDESPPRRVGLFTVENNGGLTIELSLQATPPFEIGTQESVSLAPGESRQIKVTSLLPQLNSAEGVATITTGTQVHFLRLIAPARAPAAARTSPAKSNPILAQAAGNNRAASAQQHGEPASTGLENPQNMPHSIAASDVTRTKAVISWAKPGAKEAAGYRVERRDIFLDEKGELRELWSRVDDAVISTTESGAQAKLEKLQPGTLFCYRVIGVMQNGGELQPSSPVFFQTNQPLKFRPSLLQILLAVLAVLVAAVIRQRRMRRK
jgi:hypothetical protein